MSGEVMLQVCGVVCIDMGYRYLSMPHRPTHCLLRDRDEERRDERRER